MFHRISMSSPLQTQIILNNHFIRDNTELVPRESWEFVNMGKKELEDNVKQIEEQTLRLQ